MWRDLRGSTGLVEQSQKAFLVATKWPVQVGGKLTSGCENRGQRPPAQTRWSFFRSSAWVTHFPPQEASEAELAPTKSPYNMGF